MFRLKHPHQLNFGKLIDPLESPRSIPSRPPWGTIKKLKPEDGAFKSIKLTSHSIPPNNDLYSLFFCQHWRRRRQRRRIGWVLQKVRFHLNSTPPPTPTHLQHQERSNRLRRTRPTDPLIVSVWFVCPSVSRKLLQMRGRTAGQPIKYRQWFSINLTMKQICQSIYLLVIER